MSETLEAPMDSVAASASCGCRSARSRGPAAHEAVWVYAVTADLDPEQLCHLTGVGGHPVRAVAEADLSAVVGSVDAAEFGERSLSSLLANPLNIETIGRAHHQVIASVASDGPVVPLRLATIYPDDTTIRALLAERHAELTELLRSFRGTQEWGVKVHMAPWTDDASDDPAERAGAPDDLFANEPWWQQAEACAERIDRALTDVAVAARRHPAPYPRLIDLEGRMVLNAVYLLDTERAAEFAGVVQQLTEAHSGLRADVSGPWPPYSFVDPQDA